MNHITSNIFFEEFENSQLIKQSEIKCGSCELNRSNIINNLFYKCFTCNKNLCVKCKDIHEKKHYIVNYDDTYYLCNLHKNEKYESYCENCRLNLCSACLPDHKTHNVINFKNNNDIQENNVFDDDKQQQIIFNIFKNELYSIRNMFDVIINNFELYFKIIQDIKNSYDENYINYQINYNKNNLDQNKMIKEMKDILNSDISNKLYKLYQICQKIIKRDIEDEKKQNIKISEHKDTKTPSEPKNEIEIKYKYDKNKELKLFGKEFVINNKGKCKIKYKDKIYDLQNCYNKSMFNSDEYLKIKLQISEEVTDLSYMFKDCESLTGFSSINKLNTERITDMSYMFSGCTSLNCFPVILEWKTSNVKNMCNMFNNCQSLENLPKISNWDTTNVEYMNYMFSKCTKLKSLPDINTWKTNNLKCAIGIFYQCNEKIFPDISKWNRKYQIENENQNQTTEITNQQTLYNSQYNLPVFYANNYYNLYNSPNYQYMSNFNQNNNNINNTNNNINDTNNSKNNNINDTNNSENNNINDTNNSKKNNNINDTNNSKNNNINNTNNSKNNNINDTYNSKNNNINNTNNSKKNNNDTNNSNNINRTYTYNSKNNKNINNLKYIIESNPFKNKNINNNQTDTKLSNDKDAAHFDNNKINKKTNEEFHLSGIIPGVKRLATMKGNK